MKRRWFAVFGAVFLLAVLGVVAAFPADLGSEPGIAAQLACYLLAGLLLVVGGVAPSVRGVAWYRFVGAGVVLFGVAWLLRLPGELLGGGPIPTAELVSLVAVAVTGLVFAFIGVDWFLGGRNFDLSRMQDGAIVDS